MTGSPSLGNQTNRSYPNYYKSNKMYEAIKQIFVSYGGPRPIYQSRHWLILDRYWGDTRPSVGRLSADVATDTLCLVVHRYFTDTSLIPHRYLTDTSPILHRYFNDASVDASVDTSVDTSANTRPVHALVSVDIYIYLVWTDNR